MSLFFLSLFADLKFCCEQTSLVESMVWFGHIYCSMYSTFLTTCLVDESTIKIVLVIRAAGDSRTELFWPPHQLVPINRIPEVDYFYVILIIYHIHVQSWSQLLSWFSMMKFFNKLGNVRYIKVMSSVYIKTWLEDNQLGALS